MYFDLEYIRKFLGFAIKVLLVSGILILVLGVIFTFIVDIEDDSKYTALRMANGLKYINQSVFIFGLTLVVCGLIGYLTTKVNNDITVGLFACTSLFVFASILIFTVGFGSILVSHELFRTNNYTCIQSDFFSVNERLFSKASRYYGSNKCMTNIQDVEPFMKNSQFIEKDIKIDKNNGYSNVFDCPHYYDMLEDLKMDMMTENPQYIGSLEITFQCSGICNPHPIYVFTDVNRGPPKSKKGCYFALVDYIDKYGIPAFVFIWIINFLLLMVFLYSVCLFFHPKRYDDLYIYQQLKLHDDDQQIQDQIDVNRSHERSLNPLQQRDTDEILESPKINKEMDKQSSSDTLVSINRDQYFQVNQVSKETDQSHN